MKRAAAALFADRRGATAIEYGLAVALIVIALVGGVSALGGSVAGKWNSVSNKVAAVTPS